MTAPAYDLREITLGDAARLVEAHHAYGGAANTAVACFGVVERSQVVAAYVWMPAARAVAAKVAPSAPGAALALSRMVAVPREARDLRHVSRPLRRQMRVLLDRGRWPVLVTYSDESIGHTGHVYRCSGWQPTDRVRRPAYQDAAGRRVSSYRAGVTATDGLSRLPSIWLQRWEHRVCRVGEEADWLESHGWSYADGGRTKWRRRDTPLLEWADARAEVA
jgi:hypothetical protein